MSSGRRRGMGWRCSPIPPISRAASLSRRPRQSQSAVERTAPISGWTPGSCARPSDDGEKAYPIVHVLGGKNAYYFLTPLAKGRLQVLPVAYDVPKKTWYDTAASGVRHFPDRTDSALDWTDRMFTFNTTCFNCHVSQLATNYDLATRHLPHNLGRGGHQLRVVPRSGRRARPPDDRGEGAGAHLEGYPDHPHEGVHRRADERHVRHLPRQDGARLDKLPTGRRVLRPLRPRHARAPRLLPRRPRPGRELYVHFLAEEPVRRLGQARLQPLPHRQRPPSI